MLYFSAGNVCEAFVKAIDTADPPDVRFKAGAELVWGCGLGFDDVDVVRQGSTSTTGGSKKAGGKDKNKGKGTDGGAGRKGDVDVDVDAARRKAISVLRSQLERSLLSHKRHLVPEDTAAAGRETHQTRAEAAREVIEERGQRGRGAQEGGGGEGAGTEGADASEELATPLQRVTRFLAILNNATVLRPR